MPSWMVPAAVGDLSFMSSMPKQAARSRRARGSKATQIRIMRVAESVADAVEEAEPRADSSWRKPSVRPITMQLVMIRLTKTESCLAQASKSDRLEAPGPPGSPSSR